MKSTERSQRLIKTALILLIIFLSTWILKMGAPFFIPIAFAALLSMLLFPVTRWLERKGVNKAMAAIFSILVIVGAFALIVFFIGYQVSDVAKHSKELEKQVTERYQQLQEYITQTLGVSEQKQNQMLKEQQSSSGGRMAKTVTGIIAGIGGLLTNMLLVIIYIFLFLYFRNYLKRFVLRIVPDAQADNAREVMDKSQKVSQKYLSGMALMIVVLWVMYGIGFSIVGVKNALFFAVLCGVLEIVPFIGNLVGNGLAILMTLMQGGSVNAVVGILIVYGVVQFIQSYILEPLVVGREVNINPLFTILGLVGAEMIWGIAGMVLAIPVMGVTKIICDHIDGLKPYGELMGEDKKQESGLSRKIKSIFKRGGKD